MFREGDNVSLKYGLTNGHYYDGIRMNDYIMFSGSRKVDSICDGRVQIRGWWYSDSMLEITKSVIKHVQHRHKFSPINYRNQ